MFAKVLPYCSPCWAHRCPSQVGGSRLATIKLDKTGMDWNKFGCYELIKQNEQKEFTKLRHRYLKCEVLRAKAKQAIRNQWE